MSVDSYLDTLRTSTPQGKDLKPFVDSISNACEEIRKQFHTPAYVVDREAAEILYWSFMASRPDEWLHRFNDARKKAVKFWTNPRTYWKTTALGVYTPSIEKVCREFIPSFDPEKYSIKASDPPATHKIGPELTPGLKRKYPHKRGQLWKLDRRWDHLWPSSHKIFTELCRRTQKPKKPFAFPWCQAGIPSIVRFTRVSECQVKRALQQLQNYSLIKRIVRGYEGTRGSKYYVFLTPKMSGAFYWKALQTKKHPLFKKRISRIA